MIPIYKPFITNKEKQYVNECLDTEWISSRGDFINRFEKAVGSYLNIDYVSSCSNGTVSLMLIVAALQKLKWIKSKGIFLVPSLTYAASLSQPMWLGYKPSLFDCNEYGQPSFESFRDLYLFYKRYGHHEDIQFVVLPELYGSSPDINKFVEFCDEENLIIIEDSAEVFGTEYCGKKLGTFGLASSFSFFGNKTITTGEGGVVCTYNEELYHTVELLKSQSHVSNFVHDGPGFNYRMTNIEAAIGLAQIERIDNIIERKQFVANFYRRYLINSEVVDNHSDINYSSEWMPLIYSDYEYDYLYNYFKSYQIDIRPCFKPIHRMNNWDFEYYISLKNSDYVSSHHFNLPSYPTLTHVELSWIIEADKALRK